MERHGGGDILAGRGEGVKKYFSPTMEEEEEEEEHKTFHGHVPLPWLDFRRSLLNF